MSNIKNTNPEDIIKDDIKKYCCVAVAPTVGIFLIGCGARENDINYIEVKNPKTYKFFFEWCVKIFLTKVLFEKNFIWNIIDSL